MKVFYLFLILFSISFHELEAQTHQRSPESNNKLAERFSTNRVDKMVYSLSVIPNWFKNSDRFWYIYKTSKGTKYYIVDPLKSHKREIFNNAKLAAAISEYTGDPYDAANLPIGRLMLKGDTSFVFEVIGKSQPSSVIRSGSSNVQSPIIYGFEYNINSNRLKHITKYKSPKFYPVWGSVSPKMEHVIFSKGFNLYYMTWSDYEKAKENPFDNSINEIQITFDGSAEFSYGPPQVDYSKVDAEKSIRRRPNLVWSPDSKHFVVLRTDFGKVKDLWVINSLSEPRPELEIYKYHMPGESSAPKNHILIFSIDSLYLTDGRFLSDTDSSRAKKYKEISAYMFKDQDLIIHAKPQLQKNKFDSIKHDVWEGDNSRFYFSRVSRDHKRVDLCSYLLEKDSVLSVIEERSNTYLETREPLFTKDEIFWWSQRDGWAHIYRYSKDGLLKNRVTEGEFHVEEIIGSDLSAHNLYLTINGIDKSVNPYYSFQFRFSTDGSSYKPLNKGNFNHKTYTSDSGKYLVDNFSRVNTVPSSYLYDNNGNLIMELERSDFSQLMESGYKFPEPFVTKAADGKTDLYGVIYKPFDFDSTKKYPIIQYVYPGPHTEAVNYSWSSDMSETDRLAQIGFIVVTVGNRGGHPSRSKWYHNYGYGNLRDYGIEDRKRVVENLAARYSYIDIDRVGIHGHSGGGFMSATAILTYPNFYKVAIAASGNHDNKIYNRWWGEKHHGVYETITDKGDTVFRFSVKDNISIASNLKGKLLLITGDKDDNVHMASTLRLAKSLIDAKKRFDMFIVPGQRHLFTASVKEYLFWIKADYFSKYLLNSREKEADIIEISNN